MPTPCLLHDQDRRVPTLQSAPTSVLSLSTLIFVPIPCPLLKPVCPPAPIAGSMHRAPGSRPLSRVQKCITTTRELQRILASLEVLTGHARIFTKVSLGHTEKHTNPLCPPASNLANIFSAQREAGQPTRMNCDRFSSARIR